MWSAWRFLSQIIDHQDLTAKSIYIAIHLQLFSKFHLFYCNTFNLYLIVWYFFTQILVVPIFLSSAGGWSPANRCVASWRCWLIYMGIYFFLMFLSYCHKVKTIKWLIANSCLYTLSFSKYGKFPQAIFRSSAFTCTKKNQIFRI